MLKHLRAVLAEHLPGAMVCVVIALAATFLSEHFGGPQLLYALLIGLAFHFLITHPQIRTGVDFCGRTLLRLGVALLGARITFEQISRLGVATGVLIALALACTIGFGMLLARWLGRPASQGLLSGGAVAICGASAALAISAADARQRTLHAAGGGRRDGAVHAGHGDLPVHGVGAGPGAAGGGHLSGRHHP